MPTLLSGKVILVVFEAFALLKCYAL